MPNPQGAERRKYVRVSADFPVSITFEGVSITYPAAFARDISSGGIGIEIAGQYPDSYDKLTSTSGPVNVEVHMTEEQVINVRASVVWSHVAGKEGDEDRPFKIGMQFAELDDDTKATLTAFIKEKVDQALKDHAASRQERRTPLPGSNESV